MPRTESYSSGLDDLTDFEPNTRKPAKPRLRGLSAALGLYHTAVSDDSGSALKRGRIDTMFDGGAPYDQRRLIAAGQGGRCNLNFGDAQRLLDAAQAGYVDLLESVEFLTDVHTRATEENILQDEADAILNEELTRVLRSWPEFAPRFFTLSTEFLKHGVGVAYFDDQHEWRFQVAGLKDFKFPRNTRANEEAMDVGFVRRDYTVHELFEFIENTEAAMDEGWVIEAVQEAIMRATRGEKDEKGYDWEAYQQMAKNADTYGAMQNKTVRLVHMWVKEANGQVSHYMWEECHSKLAKKGPPSQPKAFAGADKEFLYKAEFVHDRSQEAFTIFTYGVGNNGTYHSIRGLGHRIFPQVQYLNRLQCQMADAAAIQGGLLLQPNSMEDLRDVAMQFYGPYNVLRPNIDVVDRKATPDLTKGMLPVVSDLRQQLEDTSDFYSTSRAAQGSPYRNTLQVRAELESATRLSAANLALFYNALDRLIREVVRRIVDGPKDDDGISEFYKRCKDRGLTDDQIQSVDHTRTRAARAVGAGNPAARIAVLDQLDQERPWMDEEGNRVLTFDRVAARIGHDQAKRYVRKGEAPRGSNEQSLAVLENALIQLGQQVPVLSAQFHGTHLEMHLPMAQQFIDGVVRGEVDPRTQLPTLSAIGTHVLQHASALSADPTQQDIVAAAQDVSNKLTQIVENTERSIESDGGEEGAGGENAKAAELQQLAEVKRQILVEDAELKRRLKEEEFRQDQRLRDFAEAADAQRRAGVAQQQALAEPFPV